MRVGLVTVAYHEPRFIEKFLQHIPDWVEDKIVLNSAKPWFGEELGEDKTAQLARPYATVIRRHWKSEEDQRNTGQSLHSDKDWVLILDPDEFLDNHAWDQLHKYLKQTDSDAVVVEGQYTMWKNGYVADPPRDYQMLIAARPSVKFVDKRVVGSAYSVAPIWLYHFSWAKTDEEVWNKISHYAHAKDFNIKDWYENVWKRWQPGDMDVHPTTPETLHDFKRVILPPEIEELGLWP